MIYYKDLIIFSDEIINIIYSFIGKNTLSYIVNDLIKNKYENDFHPYFIKNFNDFYKFRYSFSEWYFLVRKKINNKKKFIYTPKNLSIGYDKINYKY
jgi:hypothetical protein